MPMADPGDVAPGLRLPIAHPTAVSLRFDSPVLSIVSKSDLFSDQLSSLDSSSPSSSRQTESPTAPQLSVTTMVERLRSAIWGPPSIERTLLIKLDSTILIYFSLLWFLFGINRASYSTAYISGMDQALNFQGKDFNYMNTIFIVTYAVFQIPSTSLLTIAPPRYVFVAANTLWSILTLVTFRVERVWQVFVLNGFEGALSAVC
jgi:ACS family pantothenate transporter-like MFS transporter